LVVGVLTAMLANAAPSDHMRVALRLTAWAISAIVFAAHIGYEHARLRSSPGRTALHGSFGVGLGALALAIAARLHAQTASPPQHFPAFALAVWPVMTALPAFLVAFAAATVLARTRRSV
jgi:hypothetical protein